MRQDRHLSNSQVLNSFVRNRYRAAAVIALATMAGAAARLPAQSAGPGPDVGHMAPDFTLSGARAGQVLTTPVKLSDYRGKTVVLAFFFKARTSGCTHQMEAYRDRYGSLFHGGQNVVLIAVSTDDSKTLASWSADEKFPFVLASDAAGAAGMQYGTFDPGAKMDERTLFVIGPDGKITYRARPFRELVESAYTDLGSAVAKAGG
jgi:thioredoxin-dependent peroxiredoxin